MIDTTVLIDVLRGNQAAGDRMRSLPRRPLVSAVSITEVYRGMRESERPATEDLFTWVRVVPVTPEEARIAGEWQREYATRGITINLGDALIAATALTHRAVLATDNVRHFPMPELQVEHWPSGG